MLKFEIMRANKQPHGQPFYGMRAGSKWNPRFFLVTALFLISISPSFCELLASSHAPRNLGEKYLESRHRLAKDVVRNPVIFVPGFAGSGIEVSLKDFKSQSVCQFVITAKWRRFSWYCGRNSPFFPLWLNIPDALFAKACLFEELTAIYDRKSGNWSNAAGVILRPKDWGGLGGVDFLSTVLGLHVDKTSVFSQSVLYAASAFTGCDGTVSSLPSSSSAFRISVSCAVPPMTSASRPTWLTSTGTGMPLWSSSRIPTSATAIRVFSWSPTRWAA